MSLYRTFKRMQTGPVMVGIAIFALVTFSVTGAMISFFSPDPRAASCLWMSARVALSGSRVTADRPTNVSRAWRRAISATSGSC